MSVPDVIPWPFDTPAVAFAGIATSRGGIAGFATGVPCVWLVAGENAWNWPIGILNNLAFLVLFATSDLHADSGLQVVHVAPALYSWCAWLRGGVGRTPLPVSRIGREPWPWLLAAGVASTLPLVWVLTSFTTSTVPWADSATTVPSPPATWGQTREKVECWWLWIAADVIHVPLYAYKGLWPTAILHVGFTALCVPGLRNRRKALREDGRDGSVAA